MKKLIAICLLATMCLVDTSAQTMENEVINTIMARRSVRKYLDKPVEMRSWRLLSVVASMHQAA